MIHEGVAQVAYMLDDCEGTPQVILMSSGSEVHIARDAYLATARRGDQSAAWSRCPPGKSSRRRTTPISESVLPSRVTARVSIEAGVTQGWEKYVGSGGIAIGLDRFGASAPYEEVYEHLGITAEKMVEAAKSLL